MADYKGLTIKLGADDTDATKALHNISEQAKTTQSVLTGVQGAFKNLATNGKELDAALRSLQLEKMGEAAKLAGDKASAYSQVLERQRGILEGLQSRLSNAREALASMGSKWDEAGGKADVYAARVQGTMRGVVSATEALESCKKGTTEYARAQEALQDAYEANVAALTQYKESLDGTFTAFGTAEGRINSLEAKEQSVSDSIERTNANMLMQESAANAAAAAAEAYVVKLAAAETTLGRFGAAATEYGTALTNLGESMTAVGDKMSLVSGIAAMTFGRDIISSTEDFGNAMSQLGGYLDITGAKLGEMRQLALDFGKDTQFSATEAAQAMNELAKGGMSQAQIAGGALDATMQLAAAGELDMASAAETAVQAINVFNKDAGDASAVADALAGAANKSTAEVRDLAQGFSQIGSAAGMAGWDLNEVVGALALLADHGFSGAEAGTTLKTTLQRLASPTKKAAETMESLGIEVYGADGKMKDALDVVGQFEQALGKLTDEQQNKALLDIFGMRGINGMTAILDDGTAKFREYIAATEQAGYASEMAQSRMGDLGWALEYMRGEVETAAVNFGNALAPTIIKVAEGIESLTGWFNSLSSGTQTAIANAATLTLAIGPVLSIGGRLIGGIGSLVAGIGSVTSTIANFAELVKGGGSVVASLAEAIALTETPLNTTAEGMLKVAERASELETAFTSLATGGAVALGVAIATQLVGAIVEFNEHADLVHDATDGIREAMESAGSAVSEMSDKLEASTRTSEEVRKAYDGLLQTAREFGESITSAFGDANANTSMLERYAEVMEDLSGKGNLTKGEMEHLRVAVEEFNKIAGTSISIIDEQTGRLSVQPDKIRDIISAYREYAEVQAYTELYTEAIKNQEKAQEELERGAEELAKAEQELSDAYKSHSLTSKETLDHVNELRKGQEEGKEAVEAYQDAIDRYGSKLDQAASSAADYEATLKSVGAVSESTADDIEDSADQAADAVEDASSRAKRAIEDATTAAKRAQEDELTNFKRAQEDEYNSAKSAYSAAESQLKSSLDAQYEQNKRALDNAYNLKKDEYSRQEKQLQEALKAEYDQQKAAYDQQIKLLEDAEDKRVSAIEDALKQERDAYAKALSDELDAYKAELKRGESELKKSLDRQYKERSKAAQKEAKQWSKENQKVLKDAKAAYSAQTKAFKDETSKRIAAIKAEYDARKKALADNDGTKEIDARIAALKGETDAERDAIKRRENDEKTAELRRAVEQAKTRRTRQDAEAELNEWLAQLAQEQREAEREQLIAQLEDEKATIAERTKLKQDEMDAERDRIIADYEARREVELEQLQANQDAAYEKLAEKLDEQLELRKAKQDEQLQAYRDSLDAELEQLKEHDAELVGYRQEQNAALLAEMDANHAARIAQEEEHSAQLIEAEKNAAAASLAQLEADNASRLESLKAANDADLQATKDSNDAFLAAEKAANDAAVKSMTESNATALAELKRQQEDALTEFKRNQEDAMTQLKRDLEDGKNSVETNTGAAAEATKTNSSDAANAVKTNSSEAANAVKTNVEEASRDVNEKTGGTARFVRDKFGEIKGIVHDDSKQAADDAGKNFGAISKSAETELPKVKTAAQNGIKPVGEAVTNELDKAAKDAEQKSREIPEGVGRGIEGSDSPASAMGNVADAAVNKAGEYDSDFHTVGENWATGLANGISDNSHVIENAARNAAINAYNEAMSALNAHSPSRKMMEVGKWFDLGMAEGIDRNADEVDDSARNLATAAMDATQVDAAKPDLFDADALRRGAGLYMDEYQRAMSEIEDMTRRFSKTQGDLLVEGMATAASRMRRQIEDAIGGIDTSVSRAVNGLTDRITASLGGFRNYGAPTIVVQSMTVRSESDIRSVSERLYRLQQQAERRALA